MDPSLAILRRESSFRPLLGLFFLSGAASLTYEVLWGRQLHLVFGTSQVAVATVLAAYMGGLALGSAGVARLADRLRRPLLLYGLVEAGVGLYALAFPSLLRAVEPLYFAFWRAFEPSPLAFSAFQALLVGSLLLLPTAGMGATLPLLARFATTRLSHAGGRVGLLYGVNTAGAVLGTLLTGFFLLPGLGLSHTTWLAAATNLLLAAGAVLLSRSSESAPPEAEPDLPPAPPPPRGLLLVLGLAGFAALVYELAWFRVMTLVLGGSTYAFSLMLLAFLLGLAAGGAWGGGLGDRLLARHGRGAVLLAVAAAQLGVGLLSYLALHVVQWLPYLYVDLYTAVERSPELFWPAQLLLAAGVMLPSTFFMGATFPLALRALLGDPRALGGPVGRAYAVNTLGGIAGALLAAFVFLPRLRVVGSVRLAVEVNLLAGALALLAALSLLPAEGEARGGAALARVRRLLAGALAALALLVGLRPPPWDPLLMTAGMYKYVSDLSERSWEHVYDFAVRGYELLYYAEGLSSVVTVARTVETGNVWLANNGKVDASSTVDMPTQELVAHLPFLYGRELRRGCVIGLASGVSAGSVLLHPEVRELEVVELEPAVVRASHYFDHVNHRPLEDPRTRLVLDDARNHLLLAPPGRYDFVVSEPSNPWLSGVSNLFTLEFFQQGRERLAPGGIWSQWVQMYGMGAAELRALLHTFAEAFPHVAVFATIEDADIVLLGSDRPLRLDAERAKALFRDPAFAADMERIDVHDAYDLLARFQLDTAGVRAVAGDAPLNTDDDMLVEFAAPRHLHEETASANYLLLLAESRPPVEALHGREDFVGLARAYAAREEWVKAMLVLKDWVLAHPEDEEVKALGREYQLRFHEELVSSGGEGA